MTSIHDIHDQTRRHFFGQCGVGVGIIALNELFARDASGRHIPKINPTQPMAARKPPLAGKVKNVIFLSMAGAPSQLELFEYKPKLNELSGKAPPASLLKGKRFAFLKGNETLLGSTRKFSRHGQCGMHISEMFPHHRKIADEVTWLRGMTTDVFNHGPAKLFMNTGFQAPGRPSMGSWVTYGLGSESQDLPGFVVLQSGPRGPRAGNSLWASGFLPTSFQGVPFRSSGDPILYLKSPDGLTREKERAFYDTVSQLNHIRMQKTGDPEILTRLNAYEMAYRMQTSVPEVMDVSNEPDYIFDMYGEDSKNPGTFAANCLLARKLVEKDVKFIQLYHQGWDQHGNLNNDIKIQCKETDQASAALIKDLKQRGLLEDTLVIWGGEFGRTSYTQGSIDSPSYGRDHHPRCFTIFMAGAGVKKGITYGATDEFGYNLTEDPVHVHDFQATIMHLLGIDHERLTFKHQGRRYRLTDVHGHVVKNILS